MSYLAKTAAWTIENIVKEAHVHRLLERRGWSVIARVSADELVRCAELLLAARHEVLSCTRTLPGTFPVRFREKKQGFCINFGFVENESQACWDVVATGQCCRGKACRWQHPRNNRRLFVAVKLATNGASPQGGEEQESEEDEAMG